MDFFEALIFGHLKWGWGKGIYLRRILHHLFIQENFVGEMDSFIQHLVSAGCKTIGVCTQILSEKLSPKQVFFP